VLLDKEMLCEVDDMQLVKSVLNGNIDSFNEIIYRYEASIYKFVLAMVKEPEDAKDITQDVFITLYNKLYTYRGKSKFSSWVYQIARNKSIDYIRKNKRIIKLNIEEAFDISSNEPMPEQRYEFKETKAEIESFLKCLDDITRQIIILKALDEDMKFCDIADILNVNVSTVKTKYYRLWDKYNKYLNEKRCKAL
jgi:RNA polymerase sigma-70 factor (ECF subfamily)